MNDSRVSHFFLGPMGVTREPAVTSQSYANVKGPLGFVRFPVLVLSVLLPHFTPNLASMTD